MRWAGWALWVGSAPCARGRALALLLALSALGSAATPTLEAQQVARRDPLSPLQEGALLRQASALEWQGRLDDAEAVLSDVLSRNPVSSSALFSLERVLRTLGRVREMLGWADASLEADPTLAAPRYLKLRVLAEVDSLEAIDEVAEDWYRAEPGSALPYREVARVLEQAAGPEAALRVLARARDALDDPRSLALELGDLRVRAGDARGALEAWAEALGAADVEGSAVVRRVLRLPDETDVDAVLSALQQAQPSDPERWLAALDLAFVRAPEPRAVDIVRRGAEQLPELERASFLREVSRRAERTSRADVSLWALQALRDEAQAGRSASLSGMDETRLRETALAAGDTAEAVAAQLRQVRRLTTGSDARRDALIDLVRIEAAWSRTTSATLLERWRTLRGEWAAGAVFDAVTAALTRALLERGDLEAARLTVADDPGPRTRVEHGWLLLAEGQLGAGQQLLRSVVPALGPDEATEVLEVLASLSRTGAGSAAVLAAAWAEARHGRFEVGLARIEDQLGLASDEERPALHHAAARIALDAGEPLRAEPHLEALADRSDRPVERPEALLALARIQAARPDGTEAARQLLTQLILEHPAAAIVPEARHELETLERGSR